MLQKTKYDIVRAEVVKQLSTETGFTPAYIRMSLKGERKSVQAEEIKKEFNKRYNKIKQALKN